MNRRFYHILFPLLLIAASCTDQIPIDVDELAGEKIVVGITTSPLDISVSGNATRAQHIQDAEEVEWLIPKLKDGLDITYGKINEDGSHGNEEVAILKLKESDGNDPFDKDPITGWAKYSFKYKEGDNKDKDAVWYGNGEHYFEGMFIPEALRNRTGVLDDQSKSENYEMLEHYLAMPANTQIHATVGRVKLPFHHRLSRVIAYILIDPAMSTDPNDPVTLKGFKMDSNGQPTATEDPATTSIRFCNVETLTGVSDLAPQWTKVRKVIPHFEGEEGSEVQAVDGSFETKDANLYMFYDDNTQEYIFPTMPEWTTYYNKYKNASDAELTSAKVTRTNYGKVPVYDLLVRPTYSDKKSVMYDEKNADSQPLTDAEKTALVSKKNKIEFELTLSNGLIYTKEFEFDLNANEQTVVYLRISRESVDYNATGTQIWNKKESVDDWYGVDNRGDHSLSKVGSSWQRAYVFGSTVSEDDVTDGGYYNESTGDNDGIVGQYVTASTWIDNFSQAFEGGKNHGDYFVLTGNITIDARKLPDNFVFTGHLDARGHTITLTNTGESWTDYLEAKTEEQLNGTVYSDKNGTEFTLPDLYEKTDVVPATYYTADEAAAWNAEHADEIAAGTASAKQEGDIKTQEIPAHYDEISPKPAVYQVKTGTYYTRTGEEPNYTYTEYVLPTLYYAVHHTSGTTLFAGLNGKYSAVDGVANVHNGVPYTDGTTGWRAEVMNLTVAGLLFSDDVYSGSRNGYDVTKVSGNVQNCSDSNGKVPNHTPALFKY